MLPTDSSNQPDQGQKTRQREPRRGLDQLGVRAHNERLVLSLVRQAGKLARADIARQTGLSAQTASVIIRALESDGLLVRGQPIKGKVGQPLVPMSLAADGALCFGLKVGRRSADLILMNLIGEVRAQQRISYAYPLPDPILAFVKSGTKQLAKALSRQNRSRIAGIGVAVPSELWNWADKVGAISGEMEVWRHCDLASEIQSRVPYSVLIENDATAACGAELMFGHGQQYPDYLHFFIGSFVGGGVVTAGQLFTGAHGNAGALGSMPVRYGSGQIGQLIDVASLFLLEDKLRECGLDPIAVLHEGSDWIGFDDQLRTWIRNTAKHLANAIASAGAVIDMPTVVVDGGFPEHVKVELVAATNKAMESVNTLGLVKPRILPGLVGANARAIGAASLPLLDRFLLQAGGVPKHPAANADRSVGFGSDH